MPPCVPVFGQKKRPFQEDRLCQSEHINTLLGEGTFLYDAAQEKLYVTISADGVTCSTSDTPDAPADVPPVLPLT